MKLIHSKPVWLTLLCAIAAIYFAPAPQADVTGVVVLASKARSPSDVPAIDKAAVERVAFSVRELNARTVQAEQGEDWSVMSASKAPVIENTVKVPDRLVKQLTTDPKGSVPETSEPEQPKPPTLPFRYLGRVLIDGNESAFLQYRDQNLVVKTGETVAGLYRVDGISATSIDLTFLPLNAAQKLTAEQL